MLQVNVKSNFKHFQISANFDSDTGKITTLFGRSGAGKSTILRIIAGLETPETGVISQNGYLFFDDEKRINLPSFRRKFGIVFQKPNLFPHLSVTKNLQYGAHNHQNLFKDKAYRSKLIDILGIEHLLERSIEKLSGGEAQRISIARAMFSNPDMLLMDEPLSSLDQKRKKRILPLLKELVDEFQIGIIYVSHSFEEIAQISDHLVLVENGKTLAQGCPFSLSTAPEYAHILDGLDAGNIFNMVIDKHDYDFSLTKLAFTGLSFTEGHLWVPILNNPINDSIRIRIKARDVTLATEKPEHISMLNCLKGEVISVNEVDDTHSYVNIAIGHLKLTARVTRKSIFTLGITPKIPIFCLIKSVILE